VFRPGFGALHFVGRSRGRYSFGRTVFCGGRRSLGRYSFGRAVFWGGRRSLGRYSFDSSVVWGDRIWLKVPKNARFTHRTSYELTDGDPTVPVPLRASQGYKFCWSQESENGSKQTEDTSNNLLECWTANLWLYIKQHISINAQCSSLLSNLFTVRKKIVTPEPLPIGPMCIWRYRLSIGYGIKSRSSDFNSWDTLCRTSGA
jgi:hypothetical protein